ncbi:hypothetical protein Hanom_Chr06g00573361 [Helianthus anomalus]
MSFIVKKWKFFLFIYCSRWPTALFFGPFTNRHVTSLPRPTPGLKPKPQGATPKLPPSWGSDLGVLPQPTPKLPPHTPRPKSTKYF